VGAPITPLRRHNAAPLVQASAPLIQPGCSESVGATAVLAIALCKYKEEDSQSNIAQQSKGQKVKGTALLTLILLALTSTAHGQILACNVGPVVKTYGGAAWHVYACSDGRSVALITPQDSKAFPFYFFFHLQGDGRGYHLFGQGMGDKTVTNAAAIELQALTRRDLERLSAEVRTQHKP